MNFYGTNTIFDGDTIFLIKSPDSEEWSSQKASKDVEGIVFGGKMINITTKDALKSVVK